MAHPIPYHPTPSTPFIALHFISTPFNPFRFYSIPHRDISGRVQRAEQAVNKSSQAVHVGFSWARNATALVFTFVSRRATATALAMAF